MENTVFDDIMHGKDLEEITRERSIPLDILITIKIRIESVFRLQDMKEEHLDRVKENAKIQFPKYF